MNKIKAKRSSIGKAKLQRVVLFKVIWFTYFRYYGHFIDLKTEVKPELQAVSG